MKLKDRVVVITGGSKGLGKCLAEVLCKEGCKVVISSRNQKELEAVAQEIGAHPIVADVTVENDVMQLANKTVKRFASIDIWVNNAGIWLPHTPIEKMDLKRVHDMMEVNLFGTIYGSKAALNHKVTMIINILSSSALQGRAGSSGYCASKYAADGFTKSLRLEAPEIQVIGVYPGGMKTPFFDEARPSVYHKFMDPFNIAQKIVVNLKKDTPEEEQILQRPR
jgi:NAD(P)-dependent dehydrogenase (short-subunit alcohol dehydrogenase family)